MEYTQITHSNQLEVGSFYWVRSKKLAGYGTWSVSECLYSVKGESESKELKGCQVSPDNCGCLFDTYDVQGPIDKPVLKELGLVT